MQSQGLIKLAVGDIIILCTQAKSCGFPQQGCFLVFALETSGAWSHPSSPCPSRLSSGIALRFKDRWGRQARARSQLRVLGGSSSRLEPLGLIQTLLPPGLGGVRLLGGSQALTAGSRAPV